MSTKPWYEPNEPDEEGIRDAEQEGRNNPCFYCGRMMSERESERGACDACAPDERDPMPPPWRKDRP